MSGKYTQAYRNAAAGSLPDGPPVPAPKPHASVESGVVVPFQRALRTGAMLGLGGLVVYAIASRGQLGIAAGVGLVWLVVIAFWLWFILHDDFMWWLEHRLSRDLDRDGVTGKPEPPKTMRLEVSINNGQQWRFANLRLPKEGNEDNLLSFLRGVGAGLVPLSERGAAKFGYSRDEWASEDPDPKMIGLRQQLEDRGWIEWNHPSNRQQGVSLTAEGAAVVSELSKGG